MNTESAEPAGPPRSFYEAVGGEDTFTRLVHRFYQLVADDPELRPVYPAQDLGPAEEHLRLFLIQYWGGPQTYNELRGHPRLRMRHARFVIGEAERDAWLRHMRTALDELALDEALDAQLWDYLVMAAADPSLVKRPRPGRGPAALSASPRYGEALVTGPANRAGPVSGRCVGEVPPRGREAQRGGGRPPGIMCGSVCGR